LRHTANAVILATPAATTVHARGEAMASNGKKTPTTQSAPERTLRLVHTGPARGDSLPPTPNVRVTRSRQMRLPGTARDGALLDSTVTVADDEIVRVEYENGAVLWMRADELLRERGRPRADPRSGRSSGAVVWDIESTPPGAARGIVSAGIRLLEFFGIDPIKPVTAELGKALEKRQLKNREPGLYRCDLDTGALTPIADGRQALPGDRPVLVFLHGTASSFEGSFGGLRADKPAAADTRKALRERFGAHIYAFEHRTLTESPIANAQALAAHLPVGVRLSLVSHSRGGLVGELLALAQRDRSPDPLRKELVEQLFAQDRTPAVALGLPPLTAEEARERSEAYADDAKRLSSLIEVLDAQQPRIERFVRVACPARGTTLASGRLDRWLSVLDMLMPGKLFGAVADFLLAVIQRRTDPRTLPGIEAMMPGSALTLLLARPDLVTASDLSVIAGDAEGQGFFGRLKLLITDSFFAADHDLVVNTGSMSGGLRRLPEGARFRLDRGSDVSHFAYFDNDESLGWLRAGLLRGTGESAGFEPIADAPAEAPRVRSAQQRSRDAARNAPRPLAVVVPGTMGSTLSAGGRAVWLEFMRLAVGGLADIGMDAANVEPTGLLDRFYAPLVEHLERTHRVEVHPYDWRLSVRDAAQTLAARLEELLPQAEQHGQPVHIVAHSMGGLVARAMIADGEAGERVWRRICALPGSRLLMLGTPNRGSYEAVRWLTGFNATQTKLALLDLKHGSNGIVDIVRRFPGLVEMLPHEAGASAWADRGRWSQLKADIDGGFGTVDEPLLRDAKRTWALLDNAAVDPGRMLYVAGQASATVCEHELRELDWSDTRKRIEWLATAEGDGTVTWAAGRLPRLPVWFAPETSHDELCANADDRRIFRGYVDLLTTGRTEHLSQQPALPRSAVRAGADAASTLFPLPRVPAADEVPDAAAVATLGFSGARAPRAQAARALPLKVSVLHGNLAYAKYPVFVGHYAGDTIVSAEKALNQRLSNALEQRLALDLYPGAPGTHAVFWNEVPGRQPQCAVVVGLGQVGQLSASRLESSMRDAMLEQVSEWLQRPRAPGDNRNGRRKASFSSLLIGTGANSLRARDSMEAILRAALAANRTLEAARLDDRVLITEVQFVELQEDIAVGAARDLAMVVDDRELSQHVRWAPRVVIEGPGRRKRRTMSFDTSWDQRIEIKQEDDELRFIATTDRARAEETLSTGQLSLADRFIEAACASTDSNAEVAKTLFEMLLPVGFKESAPDQRGIVLLLDKDSARFPWELLEDRWSRNGRPHAITGGIIRQFKTAQFRERPAQVPGDSVLVVGNPDLAGSPHFSDLPGARNEAVEVTRLFNARSWQTLPLVDAKATDIVHGLHARGWRVLHLAGHGEHEWASAPGLPRRSGMVIGDGVFLTPGDVQQMRFVPELVFINCCHLGKTGTASKKVHRLAANLAAQFIEMGVRAVVAAGWAVDDLAALTFARRFYGELFTGAAFRDAVRRAREETHVAHPAANTWGAYQCYGDPGWRLVRRPGALDAAPPEPFVSPRELIAELENLVESARVAYDPGRQALSDEEVERPIQERLERIPGEFRGDGEKSWLARADVCAALGLAYGEVMLLQPAVEWIERALRATEGDCPVRAIEQGANYTVRLSAQRIRQGGLSARARADCVRRIRDKIAELETINGRSPTTQRLNLIASAYKRLAWVAAGDDAARAEATRKVNEVSEQSWLRATAAGDDNAATNALINGVAACVVRVALDAQAAASAPADWRRAFRDLCRARIDRARRVEQAEPVLWGEAAVGDMELAQLVLMWGEPVAAGATAAKARSERCRAHAEAAAQAFSNALARGASRGQRSSMREHVDFLLDVSTSADAEWRNALSKVREVLA
jgi:hypothetical protein